MALTNLILTVAGVSAVILLMRSDVRQSANIFKRNVRQIRHWLEEESATAAKYPPNPLPPILTISVYIFVFVKMLSRVDIHFVCLLGISNDG